MSLKQRHIKSFVLRQGKITSGQQQALVQLMPQYGIDYTEHLVNLEQYFKRANSIIIEIGFGMGQASWQIAKQNPENDYLGIEVHAPGVGSLLMSLVEHEITNMRVIQHDAVLVLKNMIMDNSIAGFHIYFPDPWHKKKHHKRRLIQMEFIDLMCGKLKDDGYIHVATDWEHYAMHMLKLFGQNKQLANQSINGDFVERPQYRPLTKFEQRGVNLGHKVWDLVFKKDAN